MDARQSGMARQVKKLIALAYLFHSLIQVSQYTTPDRSRSAVGPQWTGERDCRRQKILRRGKRAGEKKNVDSTVCPKTKELYHWFHHKQVYSGSGLPNKGISYGTC